MKSVHKKALEKPIFLLLALNIIIGLIVYRDFGLTWDEPYFYDYADALGYAYSPAEWFSGDFNLYYSYGSSADDHKTRGPAYLLLARNFVYGVRALGSDEASAWHLINFLFFQFGIYFLYRISRRWMSSSAALFASAFLSFQPMLWGHAFINPKDPPFLTFFLASLCLGFEMVDSILQDNNDKTRKIILAAFTLGIATSIRILAPLAGILVFIYFLVSLAGKHNFRAWRSFVYYGLTAIVIMLATWPFLWDSLLKNFVDVFILMSDNPTHLSVLFDGKVYSASELPRRYLPTILTLTLTEPTWLLFGFGFFIGYWKLLKSRAPDIKKQLTSLTLIFTYFLILLAYVLFRKPAMYDGMRHFFFILPPIFIFIGFAFEFFIEKTTSLFHSPRTKWLHTSLGFLLIFPGMVGIVKLHPYEYAYYNSFVGGTDGAFRSYETDYWLTCYKDAVEKINADTNTQATLFVYREAYIAVTYVEGNRETQDLRRPHDKLQTGDYVLVSTRTNEDRKIFSQLPISMQIKRGDATFCVIRQAP